MLLALGLNVVVGWGGLLDLGFVAFYGIGAYTYAILTPTSSASTSPRSSSIPLVVAVGAVAGFLLGLPSRRLSGDYLAIVTLFFLQIFLTLTTNGDNIFGHDLTGGANGILKVDPLTSSVTTWRSSTRASSLHLPLRRTRLLRRRLRRPALRQPLAHGTGLAFAARGPACRRADGHAGQLAQADGFAFGAAVAALTGTLFASLNAACSRSRSRSRC